MLPNSSVCPSGGARETRALPMVPPAPAMFSTMTRAPILSPKPCAMRRAIASLGPPAANGTTIVTCFVPLPACAEAGASSLGRRSAARRMVASNARPERANRDRTGGDRVIGISRPLNATLAGQHVTCNMSTHLDGRTKMAGRRYDAVVFDLLTALIDSWSLWNAVAGSAEAGMRWRRRYLQLTYQAGVYS